jgi:hypothetical protein
LSPADFSKFIADETEKWGKVAHSDEVGRGFRAKAAACTD